MTLKPPTCRVCGVAEYSHRCMGALKITSKPPAKSAKGKKATRP